MDEAIRAVHEKAGPGVVVIVYFSGHGIQVEGTNYLLPTDFNAASPLEAKHRAVSLSWILDGLEGKRSLLKVI